MVPLSGLHLGFLFCGVSPSGLVWETPGAPPSWHLQEFTFIKCLSHARRAASLIGVYIIYILTLNGNTTFHSAEAAGCGPRTPGQSLCSLHYLPLCSCVIFCVKKIMIAAFNHLSSPLTVHWTWDNSDLPAPEFPDLLQGLLYGTCLIDHYYIHELKSPITSSCLTLLGLRVAFHPIHADHFARQWGRTPSSLFLPRTFIPHSAVSP